MTGIAIFFLASGVLLSIFVLADTKKHPQPMSIMRIVWVLTMLWASWIGFAAYIAFGRQKGIIKPMAKKNDMPVEKFMPMPMEMPVDMPIPMPMGIELPVENDIPKENDMPMDKKMDMSMDNGQTKRPKWQGIALSTLHCGAGCVLADIIGESLAGILGFTLIAGWTIDYVLALFFGVFFQYMAIKQMGKVTLKIAINKAIKADLLSLTAWQIGMYGFMGIYLAYFADGNLSKASFEFWFIMQLAMIIGFITSYPMNIFLIKKGLKTAM